jgi:hypothetical protein
LEEFDHQLYCKVASQNMTITYPSISINLGDGNFVNFTRQQIISASVVEEMNLVGVEMPISTLEFTAIITDGSFSMFDGAIYAKLKEKLPVSVYENISNNSVFVGQYYLDTWQNKTDQLLEFTALDIIGVLEATDFDGVFWDTPVTVSEAMNQLFSPIGVAYELIGDAATRTISGWIPPGTFRDALQQICFSARVTARTARSNKLVMEVVQFPIAFRDYVVTRANAKQNYVEALPGVSKIELVSHNYSASGVLETIFDKYLEAGSHKIVFDKPYYDIVVDGAGYVSAVLGTDDGNYIGTEDGNYLEAGGAFMFGSNSVFINLSSAGQIVITGYAWLDSKRSFTYSAGESSKSKKNYLISNATLVNADRAQDVLGSLESYYNLRYLQEFVLLPSEMKISDIILSDTINSQRIIGTIQRSVINLTGGFLSVSKLLGVLPNYIPPAENPVRVARTGIAITNAGLTRNNRWRRYA